MMHVDEQVRRLERLALAAQMIDDARYELSELLDSEDHSRLKAVAYRLRDVARRAEGELLRAA